MKKSVFVLIVFSVAVLSFWAGGRFGEERSAGTRPEGGLTPVETIDEGNDDYSASMVPGTVEVSPARQPLIGVKVAAIEKRPMTYVLRLYGRVVPDEAKTYRLNASTDCWVRAAPSLEELKTALNVNPDQSDKVGKILAKWDDETKGAREILMANFQAMQSGGDVEALRAESMMAMGHLRERSEAMNAQIREVLSTEQNKAFDAWIAERAQRMRQGRPGGPPPALR